MKGLTRVKRTCNTCGKTYESQPSRNKVYCSQECRSKGSVWNIGLTKETCPKLTRPNNGKNFGEPWAKGKSKNTDARLKTISDKNKVIIQQMYDDGRIDLTKRKTDYVASAKKISDTISRKLADGTLKNQYRFVKGWYDRKNGNREYYESSYELAYMRDMDARGESWSKKHGIRIKYFDPSKNKERFYVPDFLVGGNEIREIKPLGRRDEPTNVAKFAAANEYCLTNNYTFNIITETDINL